VTRDAGELLPDVPRPWWRCPAALTAFHAQRTFFGFAMAWPLASWVAGTMKGRSGTDATLFDDGGVLLAEALRVFAPVARPLAAASVALLLIAFVVGHAALAALLDALAHPRTIGLLGRIGAATSAVPSFCSCRSHRSS